MPPEQWPRVRLPAPEPEPYQVLPVEVTNLFAALQVGIHTGRKNVRYHALKERPCQPLKRKKKAKLTSGFREDDA
eukprot:3857380-Amphidinium_carterae.1